MAANEIATRKIINNETLLTQVCTLLSAGKQVKLQAKGNSMLPFITGERDTLVIAPLSERLRVGDVVLAYVNQSCWVVHRIIRLAGQTVILMGDGNLAFTEVCAVCDIKGQVTAVVRDGKIRRHLHTWWARAEAFIWKKLLPVRRYLLPLLIGNEN